MGEGWLRRYVAGGPRTRRTPLVAGCLALLLLPLLAACGEQPPLSSAGATPARSPVNAAAAGSPTVSVSPSRETQATSSATLAAPAPAITPTIQATAAAVPCGASPGGGADRPVVSYASAAAASRASLLHYRGRTYGGGGDLSAWYGPGGTPVAAPYAVDRLLGKTFSRWQSGGQFPAGSEIYSVAGEPVERMVAVKAAGRARLFRHYPDQPPYGLDTLQVVMGTVTCFGTGRWTTPDGKRPAPGPRARLENYLFYTPATIAVERVLHGRIPAGEREIEVRQFGGVAGETPGSVVISTADSPPIPLTPGVRMILFVQPGQWPRSGPGNAPPGNYYWLWPYPAEQSHTVEDGQVAPLRARDPAAERIPLAEFLTGLAETFGVRPLDPHGPRPTPLPPGHPPTPTPRVRAGQSVNPVAWYRLDQATTVFLRRPAVLPGREPITDGPHIDAIVAALDAPLPVLAAEHPRDPYEVVVLAFFTPAGQDSVGLEYDRAAGTLTGRADPYNPFNVPAPPGFARLLGLE